MFLVQGPEGFGHHSFLAGEDGVRSWEQGRIDGVEERRRVPGLGGLPSPLDVAVAMGKACGCASVSAESPGPGASPGRSRE